MFRFAITLGLLLLAGLCGLLYYVQVERPVYAELDWVEKQVADIQPTSVEFPQPEWNFNTWHEAITGKKALWERIVPPAAPPPPKEDTPPDLADLLKEVQATRAQIGKKAQIKTPENPKGAFYAVGDTMGKFKIKTITKEFVEFSLDWKGQELTAKLPRK